MARRGYPPEFRRRIVAPEHEAPCYNAISAAYKGVTWGTCVPPGDQGPSLTYGVPVSTRSKSLQTIPPLAVTKVVRKPILPIWGRLES